MQHYAIALLVAASLFLPFASPATACIQVPLSDAGVVSLATDDLNAGRNPQAIERLYDRFGNTINGWAFNPTTSTPLQREVVLIVALSTLRTEGRYERSRHAYAVTDDGLVRGNVQWAIRAMEGLAFVGEASDRHLAEAWARDPSLADAARRKLQTLADRGRLLSPHQFDVLARLYLEIGDAKRAEWAHAQADQKRLD